MRIGDILSPAAVRSQAQVSSKKRLFHDLAELAAQAYGLDAGRTLDALQERESLGATGVGHGVALPHARISGLDHVAGLFLRLEKPMDFDAVDRQPVDLVFTLLAPDSPGVEHLKALALVSRTLRDERLRAKLRANTDPVALHAVLTDGPEPSAG
ncbi:PTS sugar transporter subunit IIA [Paracoccus contaminans]|uniref:PTS lactose transporter subunit IIC n=1 Tax=Paracoccus contaminans TaxID=1945662 RepID=A0A1W6CXE4_9RHOB|nr:PTS sugar transporter subunit IIA [Paracoccus contaminans]ARJ69530.1 PTS lactose transporter subunit IIC [Paracoccus contaminans]